MAKNPHADFTPTLAGYSGITPFRFWCQTALPLTYDDSLSYYELLNKVVNYLNHTIEDLTNVENNTSELAEAYEKLQKYVNDYFDDIDIEAELRNVLDGMAEDGTLDALLDPIVANRLPGVVEEQIDGAVAEQIDDAVEGQIGDVVGQQLPPLVDANIGEEVSEWLDNNVDPVGSAVLVDSTLSISGAAADAKVTGDEIRNIKKQIIDYKGTNLAQGVVFVDGKQIRYADGRYVNSGTLSAEQEFINISGISKIVYMRRVSNSTVEPTNGMAFYSTNDESGYLSGIPSDYREGGGDPYLYEVDVPENAQYARFTYLGLNDPNIIRFPFALYDAEDYHKSFTYKVNKNESDIEELNDDIDDLNNDLNGVESMLVYDKNVNFSNFPTTKFYISPSNNTWLSNANVESYFIPVNSSVRKISVTANNESNAYIAFLKDDNVILGNTPNYATGYSSRTTIDVGTSETFTIPDDCEIVYVWGKNATSTFLPSLTTLHYFSDVIGMEEDIAKLKTYHPKYTNKKVSILGDSISTFCAEDEKVTIDEHVCAGPDCETNYPGNIVKYSASDVVNVEDTWWKKVINYYDMSLGINESWAGSCIGYNPEQTNSGRYTADNCLCSQTRIDHLDDNGTPDVILVFGGTNDINHHRLGNTSGLRYAVGELDSMHNPLDYANFPMETATYYGSITTMLLRLQHTYPNATILMVLPYFCTSTHASTGDIATPYDQNEWANAAIDVCKYLGVEYLDLRTIINLYDVSSLLFDGLHPKANGMNAIAKAVIHKLDSML